jgi:glycosyltransferase involved in cell wall biosynthesis
MSRVSIGLPVYNGERFLSASMDSLLAQTFRDFELVISDNASTDATGEICRAYAERDRRVRYVRSEQNIGSAPNFNRVVQLSSAPYFTWAAHDDVRAPRFLERCVEKLDRDPSVVLAYTRGSVIDESGDHVRDFCDGPDLLSPSPYERLHRWLFQPHVAYHAFFGVIRTPVLAQALPLANCAGNDELFLAHVVLLGKYYEVPELLFFNREHRARASTAYVGVEQSLWFDPGNRGKVPIPRTRRIAGWLRAVMSAPMSPVDRARCLVLVARYAHWYSRLLAVETWQSSRHWAAGFLRSKRGR